MSNREHQVRAALQLALLGEVSSNLRAVVASFTDTKIHFDCYYDGDVSEDDKESMSCAETELIAAFPETHKVTHAVHRKDSPNPIPKEGLWVFRRREN